MYNLDFIYDHSGLSDLPAEIDRGRLFNVSFDISSGDIKLYILDRSERFAYKVSQAAITRQYSGDDAEFGGSEARLNRFLGAEFDYRQIVIDAVEGDSYYVDLQGARGREFLRFVRSYCQRFNISEQQLVAKAGLINHRRYDDLEHCYRERAIAMLRIPLAGGDSKVYALPFLQGGSGDSTLQLNARTLDFLSKLYDCSPEQLPPRLQHLWLVTEINGDRTLVVTQYHELLHRAE